MNEIRRILTLACKIEANRHEVIEHLQITESEARVAKLWSTANVISLRPWNGETRMVVGCGNNINLLPCGEGLPLYEYAPTYVPEYLPKCCNYSWCPNWVSEFTPKAARHHHCGQFTVCDQFEWNPSVVALFGRDDLTPALPKESFDEIIFESIAPGVHDTWLDAVTEDDITTNVVKTVLYLLRLGGRAKFTGGSSVVLEKTDDQTLEVIYTEYKERSSVVHTEREYVLLFTY